MRAEKIQQQVQIWDRLCREGENRIISTEESGDVKCGVDSGLTSIIEQGARWTARRAVVSTGPWSHHASTGPRWQIA